ncbi:MAG: M1 family metallopeptidase [Clostridia bacterium]|nr:M1 family metallopeptidase [Clostridia bacterium]
MKRWVAFCVLLGMLAMLIPAVSACKSVGKSYAKYEITAEYAPENKTLAGVVKVTYENGGENALSVLKFQLYPNAYRKDAKYKPVSLTYQNEAYYAGESYGEMVISSVNGSKGWEVAGEDENILYVYLPQTLYPGEKTVVDVGFMTKLACVEHRTGIAKRTVNLGNCFPILCGEKDGGFYECNYYADGDPFYSDCADYKLNLTLPKEYVVASTGADGEEDILESKKVYSVSASNVRDFALVISKDFRVLETYLSGTRIAYYYYADLTPEKTLEVVRESFTFYVTAFGAYPYDGYSVVETGLCFAGAEYPCLTMLSDKLTGEEKVRTLAHETAHQWWYAVVGSDQVENAWQDEGLSEYSAVLFFENYEKYELTRDELVTQALREYRSYYDVYGSVLGRTDTRMTRNLKDYLNEYEYRCLSYDKAVVMFDTLRKSVGDKKFLSALAKYYQANIFQTVGCGELIGAFEKAGVDTRGFFESFLNGKGVL